MPGQNDLPSAAWYPDPYGVSSLRWWDGAQWTDAVHPPVTSPVSITAPHAAPVMGLPNAAHNPGTASGSFSQPSQLPSQQPANQIMSQIVTAQTAAAVSQQQASIATPLTSPAPVAPALAGSGSPAPESGPPLGAGAAATVDEDSTGGHYEWSRESRAFDTFPGSAMPVSIAPRTSLSSMVVTNTASSWVIAFMPLLTIVGIVAAMVVLASVPALRVAGLPSELLLASVAGAFYLITVLFAIGDSRRLYSNGLDRPPHWAWALLSAPIYLIARLVAVRHETRRFTPGQLIVHVLLLAGGVFLALNFTSVVWPFLISLMEMLL